MHEKRPLYRGGHISGSTCGFRRTVKISDLWRLGSYRAPGSLIAPATAAVRAAVIMPMKVTVIMSQALWKCGSGAPERLNFDMPTNSFTGG